MIIKSTRIRTSAGCRRLAAHLENGEENERVSRERGTVRDLEDCVTDARRFGRTYALRHFIVAPEQPLTTAQFGQILQMLADEFGFPVDRSVVYRHWKDRADARAFDQHLHIVVPEVDPISGRVLSSAHDFLRHEKLARVAEHAFGHRAVRGAHHQATITALIGEGRTDVAHWLSEQCPDGQARPNGGFSTPVHQARKRAGIDVAILRQHVRSAWAEARSGAEFQNRLRAHGMAARRGDRVWIIETVTGDYVGRAHALARARLRDVEARLEAINERHDDDPRGTSNLSPSEGRPRGGREAPTSPPAAGDQSWRRRSGRPALDDSAIHSDNDAGGSRAAGPGVLLADGAARAQLGRALITCASARRPLLRDILFGAHAASRSVLDRAFSDLDDRETAARAIVARADLPPPDPPSLTRLKRNVSALKDERYNEWINLRSAQEALAEHVASRPSWVKTHLTGAGREFETRRCQLQARVDTLSETYSRLQTSVQFAQQLVDDEQLRWAKEAASIAGDRQRAAWSAQADLRYCAEARAILQKSPFLAQCGIDTLIRLGRDYVEGARESRWNGLAITDIWGIGQLGPR